jgi:hypothetical protein
MHAHAEGRACERVRPLRFKTRPSQRGSDQPRWGAPVTVLRTLLARTLETVGPSPRGTWGSTHGSARGWALPRPRWWRPLVELWEGSVLELAEVKEHVVLTSLASSMHVVTPCSPASSLGRAIEMRA